MDVPVADLPGLSGAEIAENLGTALDLLRKDGILIIRQGIEPAMLDELKQMATTWHDDFLSGEVQNYSLGDPETTATVVPDINQDTFVEPRDKQGFRKWNMASKDARMLPLVDVSPLYDVIHAFIGPDLQVTKTQLIVLPPDCLDSQFLHTDAGSLSDIVESMDASPVMVSAQVFLTDLLEPGMGNFTCVPGSHQQRYPWSPDNPTRTQIGTVPLGQEIPLDIRRQVLARAGDVVIFLHSLWHGVTPNTSAQTRRSLILSYGKSFVRPYDYQQTPPLVLKAGTPRQRLLFGDLGGWGWQDGCYYHLPEDHIQTLAPGEP
ncbi:phytanoyl-CoA dioxygenase family protein [Nocardia altamirensis]|uniref:phytanoyl-CoA dioxygenase family protein n=1 Tax=Nocardia altamirensis TaxID=472158 RepID=UPI00084079D3|nr:phytanoyl-CoA dioxygenase family protein [Nocardia altamirensis]